MYAKSLCIPLSVLAICLTSISVFDAYLNDIAEQRKAAQLTLFMTGGLPALHARCILETPQPEAIKDCIRLGTPTPGREL